MFGEKVLRQLQMAASGMPWPSTMRWCLLPSRALGFQPFCIRGHSTSSQKLHKQLHATPGQLCPCERAALTRRFRASGRQSLDPLAAHSYGDRRTDGPSPFRHNFAQRPGGQGCCGRKPAAADAGTTPRVAPCRVLHDGGTPPRRPNRTPRTPAPRPTAPTRRRPRPSSTPRARRSTPTTRRTQRTGPSGQRPTRKSKTPFGPSGDWITPSERATAYPMRGRACDPPDWRRTPIPVLSLFQPAGLACSLG